MCTFTVFRLGRTAPHFRPNEGAGGGKAGYIRDLNSLRRVYPPIWRPAAGVGVRWPIRWLHWGLAVLVSGFTLLWPKNHRVYPLLAVASRPSASTTVDYRNPFVSTLIWLSQYWRRHDKSSVRSMLLTIFRVTGGSAPSDSNTLLADRLITSTLLPPTSWIFSLLDKYRLRSRRCLAYCTTRLCFCFLHPATRLSQLTTGNY